MKQENAEEVIVKEAPRNEVFVGKSLAELRGIFGKKDTREALLELMRRTELRAVLWRNNVDLAMLKIALLNHRVLIGSHASGEEIPPSLAFPLYLGQVDEGESAALEKAVEKITSVPAKHFGFEGRGLIEEGYFADLAMFMFGNDLRSGSRIAEMQCVLVNGTVAIRDREVLSLKNPNEGRSGRVIRRAG